MVVDLRISCARGIGKAVARGVSILLTFRSCRTVYEARRVSKDSESTEIETNSPIMSLATQTS